MPHPIDVAVGMAVRNLRVEASMTQSQLGAAVGVSFQQIQKYEKGTNRIGSSRLVEIANALGTTASYILAKVEGAEPAEDDRLTLEAAKVARDFKRIKQSSLRAGVAQMLRALRDGPVEEVDEAA